jgi:hypothetical protein
MAELFWPSGVGDDPLKDSVQVTYPENGEYFASRPGDQRGAPVLLGKTHLLSATYPMSQHQFHGLWLPWWMARKIHGGCDQGVCAFWLREPWTRVPTRYVRQQDQSMQPVQDGLGYLVTLALRSIPQ